MRIRTSQRAARSARGSAAETSPRPPAFTKSEISGVTYRILLAASLTAVACPCDREAPAALAIEVDPSTEAKLDGGHATAGPPPRNCGTGKGVNSMRDVSFQGMTITIDRDAKIPAATRASSLRRD